MPLQASSVAHLASAVGGTETSEGEFWRINSEGGGSTGSTNLGQARPQALRSLQSGVGRSGG